ncbi:MAG: FAD-linked oxidase C-terminal domain-containing protein [Verrucomicrobiota bacterium JB022]|nr:FAD-linked oxidase C-terminal domain-containing protein [Verrucomicrobiota bacterium JB022]
MPTVPPLPVSLQSALAQLAGQLEGRLHTGQLMRRIYATDASEYQEFPLGVAVPYSEGDVRKLVAFAAQHKVPLVPRGAGTSLAGQVVSHGLIVDLGQRLNRILEIDAANRRVRVQPGVVRYELNHALQPHGMLFGPETSTANRAMIGGMVGNNSCGSNSIVYGSVREHLISCRGFLSDGSEVTFRALSPEEFVAKCEGDTLEAGIYREVRAMLADQANREAIRANFPKASIPRRNTGYALDLLMDANVFDATSDKPFNLCKLIAGSEGTLFFGVEFELDCNPLPPPHSALLCGHYETVNEALHAVGIALGHHPAAVELIDRHILEATKRNLEQQRNRFFVQGDPGAILVIDIRRESAAEVDATMVQLESELRAAGLGHAYPVLRGADQHCVWELRRAGQGLMSNVPGDDKPREIVEDTAVDVRDLPAYIEEFDQIMREKHGIECVYYAHAGTGELHTRPKFNLKTPEGLKMFRSVAEDIAALVKKYQGSLSGEHGDGRLRGEFIPRMVGEHCFGLMRQVKLAFDPHNLFNPGKIVDTPPMDTHLRIALEEEHREYDTHFDFSESLGLLRAAEQCIGSGDCRKSHLAGGTMCPSYMATKDEKDSTRARANVLRQILTAGPVEARKSVFDNDEAKEVLDLCLSCKACKSECPANVDMAKLKAEFLQGYYDANGVPLRSRMIAGFTQSQQIASKAPWAWNFIFGTPALRKLANKAVGFHPERTIPLLPPQTLAAWFRRHQPAPQAGTRGKVWLFNDEFTNYNDVAIGIKAVELLERLGYAVEIPEHGESGRTWLSKGLVREAAERVNANTRALKDKVTAEQPLVGIEPSALLTLRDEAIDLAPADLKPAARQLAKNALLFDEFLVREMEAGRLDASAFTTDARRVHLHGHCFQKALVGNAPTVRMLSLPAHYEVKVIPSGCCGMAGSFGYEEEHYAVSQQVGELVLFPAVRQADEADLIAAAGTSCRHQIHDATHKTAQHPIEILHAALV